MKKLITIITMFVALAVFAMPASAKPPFMVVGAMDPAEDVAAVQNAVDNYEKVLLRGSFNFGFANVVITEDVKICGETDEDGFPVTTIYGGFWTFYAPLPPEDFNEEGPSDPGPKITIKNIHFDGAVWTPIHISYTSGVEIKNNKITNVLPVGPYNIFGRLGSYWQGGVYLMTLFNDPRGPAAAVVPNAITGKLVIKDNEIDLEVYPPYMPRSPVDTMGQAVFVVWSWGAKVDIKGNTLRNVTRNTIELLDNYKNDKGKGSISIKKNTIVTAEEGINVPSNSTPNGIVVGWLMDPDPDPARTPEFSIKGNYIEGRGETSGGIINISVPATIKDNEIMVKDGYEVNSGAAGIIILGEGTVASGNQITINPSTTGAPGAAGSGILILSDYATVKKNEIIFDDEDFSPAVGILQLASEGMISSNKIEGLGNVAVYLLPLSGPVQNNMISKNDIEDFIPGWADVVLGVGTNNNTLVGDGGTVVDWGTDNVIIGDWTTP